LAQNDSIGYREQTLSYVPETEHVCPDCSPASVQLRLLKTNKIVRARHAPPAIPAISNPCNNSSSLSGGFRFRKEGSGAQSPPEIFWVATLTSLPYGGREEKGNVSRFAFRVSHFAFRIPRFAFRISHSAFRVSRFVFNGWNLCGLGFLLHKSGLTRPRR